MQRKVFDICRFTFQVIHYQQILEILVIHNVMLVPAGNTRGIFPVSLGLVKALNDKGTKAVLFTPFSCCCKGSCGLNQVNAKQAFLQIASGNKADVLQCIVSNYYKLVEEQNPEVVVIEGIADAKFDKDAVNADICHAFDADIITVINGVCAKSQAALDNTLLAFGNAGKNRVLGNVLLNRDAPKDASNNKKLVLSGVKSCCNGSSCCCAKHADAVENVLASIAYNPEFYAPRASEIAMFLGAEVLGDASLRGYNVCMCAKSAKAGDVLVTAVLPEATEASIVILTDGVKGEVANAAVIATEKSAWAVCEALASFPALLAPNDEKRAALCAEVAKLFDEKALATVNTFDKERTPLMSPAAFRYKLTDLARKAHKRIALPEGEEPRTICAAAKVAEENIAVPVLFGNKDKILEVAASEGVTLGEGVEFVDPTAIRENYVERLVELRKKKGMTPEQALDMLQDNVALATMMIERGELDGLVSGAIHTTANTIRPPLQIIKTAPGAKLVSAIFFMLMPEQVYVYGDCALNINPNAEELSEIAIQSADTAKAFGIDPRVAMVTYSTMNSGKGADVDLMREATELVHQKRPDIACDGPLQYDAAVMPNVAAQKAPNSPVAGKATVFIFPSLSTGNTVYKAVQRSANLVSIGPMLQGMKKPVNDLSRGALVDDIIYTIAVTAFQCTQVK